MENPHGILDRSIADVGDAHGVLDVTHRLLKAARNHPDFKEWPGIAASYADHLDAIRKETHEEAPALVSAATHGSGVSGFVKRVAANYPSTPELVVLAGVVRGLDDAYYHLLNSVWADRRMRSGPMNPDDIVVRPDWGHLAKLFPAFSPSTHATRAGNQPDETLHTNLYTPRPGVPAIEFRGDLTSQLDSLFDSPAKLATAHPVSGTDDYTAEFPLRPKDIPKHVQTCKQLLADAFDANAAVVVYPELTGFPEVTDALRSLKPKESGALVVGGSGHVTQNGKRANRAMFWVARPSGVVPSTPLVVYKRVPYEGALGAEGLELVDNTMTVQIDGPWRLAVGVCRDLLETSTIEALISVGVNLILVPLWSPRTTNFKANASYLAANGHAVVLMANCPRYYRLPTGDARSADLAIYAAPIEHTNLALSASGDPPVLILADTAQHLME